MKRSVLLALPLAALGCSDPTPDPTIPDDIFGALGAAMPAATAAQRERFARGREVAVRRFTPETGLGPRFNVSACADCHERPTVGGSGARYRRFLLTAQRLPDGSYNTTGNNGVQDQYVLPAGRDPTTPGTNVTATRSPVPFFGIGLLAEIPGSEIASRADPDDANRDGISGRANYDRGFVGRFGRKSQTASIEGFIRGPIFNHIGITSNPLSNAMKARLPVPSASVSGALSALPEGTAVQEQVAAAEEPITDNDGVPDPELSEQDLFDLVSFAMLTAAPRPDPPTPLTLRGRATFDRIGCDDCHTPALRGPRGLIPAFSDLLLHDMGDALSDGIEMRLASGREFRTQPLWGVAATGPWLHDGRADTLTDAVTLHGGEAQRSRDAFVALSPAERAEVIAFLESLGGRAQVTAGLLPPDAPLPAAGAWGGPMQGLDADALARFSRGRRRFDDDFGFAQGLGPLFNGDSCRACHFDPVPGGAGPLGVDVTRQGILDGMGRFTEPAMGTMVHRHGAVDARPPMDPLANFFELRQTPNAFGLGVIEDIPAAEITANEDPTDADGDGVRGRARRLPDGRLGRFGWKANVPSVREFVRDAMSNELGVTVPAVSGETFGNTRDGDGVTDPELRPEDLDDVAFFLARLAPPPRPAPTSPSKTGASGCSPTWAAARATAPSVTRRDGSSRSTATCCSTTSRRRTPGASPTAQRARGISARPRSGASPAARRTCTTAARAPSRRRSPRTRARRALLPAPSRR